MKQPDLIDRLSLDQTEFIIFLVAAGFLTLAVLTVIFLFISRTRKSFLVARKHDMQTQFQARFNQMIINEVFSRKDNPVAAFEFQLAELRRLIGSSKLARQTTVQLLVSMRKNLSGASGTVLDKAYKELNGHEFSSKKLKSFDWKVRAQGVREMTEMGDDSSLETIKKFVTSRRLTLREETIVSIVRLERPVTLTFLNTYEVPLSNWLKINIHYHLSKFDVRDLPDFAQWFDHKNSSVITFAVDMCKIFRRTSSIDRLIHLLDHDDKSVVKATLEALGDLEAHTAAAAIIEKVELFWADNELSQKLVICLGRIASDDSHTQALTKYLEHPNYAVRFEGVKALANLGREARRILDERNLAMGESLSSMIRHVDEPLLR